MVEINKILTHTSKNFLIWKKYVNWIFQSESAKIWIFFPFSWVVLNNKDKVTNVAIFFFNRITYSSEFISFLGKRRIRFSWGKLFHLKWGTRHIFHICIFFIYACGTSKEDKRVHTFPKSICPKVNVITWLEFELARYDSAV